MMKIEMNTSGDNKVSHMTSDKFNLNSYNKFTTQTPPFPNLTIFHSSAFIDRCANFF